MDYQRIITGPLPARVHAFIAEPAVRSYRISVDGERFGEAFDRSFLVSIDRSSGSPIIVPESSAAHAALDPHATAEDRRAGDVIRGIVNYAERTGRPIEGLGLGRTDGAFDAARSTSTMQELAQEGDLGAEQIRPALHVLGRAAGLNGVHERGRIFLNHHVANVLLRTDVDAVDPNAAAEAVRVVDHELGHVGNQRSARPLFNGDSAEAIVELRSQVGGDRIARLQHGLGFQPGGTPSRHSYVEQVQWLRGVFHRAGSTTDAAIGADLARHTSDDAMYEELGARLVERNGIDPSWAHAARSSLQAPRRHHTASQVLANLDAQLAATPRNVYFPDLLRATRDREAAARVEHRRAQELAAAKLEAQQRG